MRNRKALWLFLIVVLVAGCATLGTKPWAERAPQEKASYFMSMYNKQFNDTLNMAKNPNITDAQRKVVRTKKDILTKLWLAIGTYDSIVIRGEIPSMLDEQTILNYINQLAAAGG